MKSIISTPTGTINSIAKSDTINQAETNKFLTMFGNCETIVMPSCENDEIASNDVSQQSVYNLYNDS